MKSHHSILLCFLLIGCCTKVDCVCPGASIAFKVPDRAAFEVIVTDKQFNQQDKFDAYIFERVFDMSEGMYFSIANIEDHYFLLRNKETGSIDTITNITITRKQETSKCNDCFLKKDNVTCDVVTSQAMELNGVLVKGDTIEID